MDKVLFLLGGDGPAVPGIGPEIKIGPPECRASELFLWLLIHFFFLSDFIVFVCVSLVPVLICATSLYYICLWTIVLAIVNNEC